MKITKLVGRQILNSEGLPAIECLIFLDDDLVVNSSVPSGASKGKYEAKELIDDDKKIFLGQSVQKSIEIINNIIAPQFINQKPNAIDADIRMLQLDVTNDKSKIGSNTIYAVSMAMYKAQAIVENMELYDFIALVTGSNLVSLPIPMINFINGGLNADNNLSIQEYLVIPYGSKNVNDALEKSVLLFNSLKFLLKEKGKNTATGAQGGFASNFENDIEPLEYIQEILQKLKLNNDLFALGIDVSASNFYNPITQSYNFNNKQLSSDEIIEFYASIEKKYNLLSIQDGLDQDDWQGWIKLMNKFGNKINIAGGDIFASDSERILKGIEFSAVNSVIIKPNQIGTVTEALQAVQLCQEHGISIIISNRSYETNDTFIVDLAVGVRSNYIKCGGLSHGERTAKYNRLLEIENILNGIDDI